MIHIAATFGDPTGIGPEVGTASIKLFLKINASLRVHIFAPSQFQFKHPMVVWHDSVPSKRFFSGRPSEASGARALFDLKSASDACISGHCHALVTGPLDKFWCEKTARGFSGHTEYLEQKTRSKGTTMMLESPQLRVALVTTHISLSSVAKHLSIQKILATTLRTHDYLKEFISRPRIAVCGLNPHASDNGLFGTEESRIIAPSIRKLRARGVRAEGPFSADSLFHRADEFDAIICMYHDQGLIPIKMRHFYDTVNITLGLPFLRTSVDHGTAFDIAGKGKASSTSYGEALKHAFHWVQRSRGQSRGGSSHSRSRRSRT